MDFHGADATLISRRGQTTVDMANGPQQRVQSFPETIALLENWGAVKNNKCQSCEGQLTAARPASRSEK